MTDSELQNAIDETRAALARMAERLNAPVVKDVDRMHQIKDELAEGLGNLQALQRRRHCEARYAALSHRSAVRPVAQVD